VVVGITASLLASIATASIATDTIARADSVRDGEYWLNDYGVRAAWNTTHGEGVTIAIIDTGVDGRVGELAGAIVGGADVSGIGSADGQTPVGSENSDHGTMVASLAAGRGTGANTGVLGTAPAASILTISIAFAQGGPDSDEQIARAVRFAVDNGADVINMSLTRNTLEWPKSWDDAFLYAMDHDVVIVAAAGNRGSGTTEVGAPATMPGVLTVAGVNSAGQASFDASSQGITIGVAAPSEGLLGAVPGGGHVLWNGTSGATPIVAGIVALVIAAHPDLDAANVINRIIATARDAGTPGPDAIYGFGLINAQAAVEASVPKVTANPMGELADWITIYRRARSTPGPTPSSSHIADVPVAAGPVNPLGTILPTVNLLRNAGIPLLVFLVFGALLGWACVVGVRLFRSPRKTR
jgi:subtilisin family serine protease